MISKLKGKRGVQDWKLQGVQDRHSLVGASMISQVEFETINRELNGSKLILLT